jgi:hypothetical protein
MTIKLQEPKKVKVEIKKDNDILYGYSLYVNDSFENVYMFYFTAKRAAKLVEERGGLNPKPDIKVVYKNY